MQKSGAAAPDFRVIAFPVDRRATVLRARASSTVGVPDRGGEVLLKGLPPGEYYVAALGFETLTGSVHQDEAEFLESLVAGATRVTLTEGEQPHGQRQS